MRVQRHGPFSEVQEEQARVCQCVFASVDSLSCLRVRVVHGPVHSDQFSDPHGARPQGVPLDYAELRDVR